MDVTCGLRGGAVRERMDVVGAEEGKRVEEEGRGEGRGGWDERGGRSACSGCLE